MSASWRRASATSVRRSEATIRMPSRPSSNSHGAGAWKFTPGPPVHPAMELAQILVQLWRRRIAVVAVVAIAFFVSLALAYKVSVPPPGLSHRSISNGSAETHILVDSPRSSVADLNRSFDPLVARAQVFAQLMTTAPVVD